MCTVVPCVSQKLYRLRNGTVRKPKKKRTSRQVIKNRHRAQRISPAYATFLIVAAVCAVFICVMYLQLTGRCFESCRSDHSAAAGTDGSDRNQMILHISAAEDSVNLETVREKAMNEMGMVYAVSGQGDSIMKARQVTM